MAILNSPGHMFIAIEFLDPEKLSLDIFLYFLCQYQTVMNEFFDMLAAILDFGNHIDFFDHINSFVYIPDSENLLFEIFLHFSCQLNSEISKFSDMLAAILDFGSHIDIF